MSEDYRSSDAKLLKSSIKGAINFVETQTVEQTSQDYQLWVYKAFYKVVKGIIEES